MKKSNIFLLGLGYAAGLLVALKFSKNGEDKNLSELAEEIKAVHKTLWTEAEKKIFSEENREKVAELKARALKEIATFKKEAEKELTEYWWHIDEKGNLKKEELLAEAQKLYEAREEILENLLEEGVKIADLAKSESEEVGTKLAKKITTLRKDLKKELAETFTKIKKKLK
jgi:hypothetical protein